MKEQLTLQFWLEIGGAILLALVMYVAARFFNPEFNDDGTAKQKTMKVDYFRIPTANVLVILGLLVPVLSGLASYLYVNHPGGSYASLLASIAVMFFVLAVAIWESFAFLKIAEANDTVTIRIPQERKYIVGMGLMYSHLLLGVAYFCAFFLFELVPTPAPKAAAGPSGTSTYFLLRPKAYINQPKDELIKTWGPPKSEDTRLRKLYYEFEGSMLEVTYDDSQKLTEILDRRR
jgi:hypothetical protein